MQDSNLKKKHRRSTDVRRGADHQKPQSSNLHHSRTLPHPPALSSLRSPRCKETCRCDFGYGGAACELSSAVDCTGNGRIRDDGTCVCMPGYTGNCSVWDCSGTRGVAEGERCNCNGAWTGDRCQCRLGSLLGGSVAVNCTQCAEGAIRRRCRTQY